MIFEKLDRIVFTGDSVTDMGSVNPVGEGLRDSLGFGYVRMVENLLMSVYPELTLRVTNSGFNGNTSRDLLARWERDVLNLHPQWVSIMIGINDVWRQFDTPALTNLAVMPEDYEKNIEAMLEALQGKVKGVFLMTPYYMEPNRTDAMRARMDEYGEICRRLAEKYDCIFIDTQAMFDEYFKYQHSAYIAWDRVHPNQIGAMLLAREFLNHCGFDFNHKPSV
jgi:lysophospholipase L1-like esterase